MMGRRQFCAAVGSALLAGAMARRVTGGMSWAMAAESPDPPVSPSLRRHLFTDLRHISPGDLAWRGPDGASIPVAGPPEPPIEAIADPGGLPRGIRLVAQPARKEGPIEGLPSRLVQDGGMYRSWALRGNYPAGADLGSYSQAAIESLSIVYQESADGYAWTSLECPAVPVQGITGVDGEHFFIDTHAPASERYKCIYNARVLGDTAALWAQYEKIHPRHRDTRLRPDYIYCLFGLVSPDGLDWKPIEEPLLIHKGDTDNTVYYDTWLSKYVLYTRLYWYDRRMIARAESDDFRTWTPVDPVVAPSLDDPFSFDVYTNGRTSYPGAPEYHLMFPMFYRRYDQTSEIQLLSSVDGIRWDRVPGGPVLEPGHPGEWDGEFIVACKDLVTLGSDRIAIPYVGVTHPHKYPRWPGLIGQATGWATWPAGRLAALTADEEGEFHTLGMEAAGTELRVNARVRRAGALQVGLAGVEGRGAGDCDPITGNELAHVVTWGGDSSLKVERGATVRLHFRMRCAELFGVEWA